MYTLEFTRQFKKDYKKLSSFDIVETDKALKILEETGTLPRERYLTHPLKGKLKNHWDAHIQPDLLLIWYEKIGTTIRLIRISNHSNIFK